MLKKKTKNAISHKLLGFRGSYFTQKSQLSNIPLVAFIQGYRNEKKKKSGKEAFDNIIVVDYINCGKIVVKISFFINTTANNILRKNVCI